MLWRGLALRVTVIASTRTLTESCKSKTKRIAKWGSACSSERAHQAVMELLLSRPFVEFSVEPIHDRGGDELPASWKGAHSVTSVARLPRPPAELTVASPRICRALPRPACACAVAAPAPPCESSLACPFVLAVVSHFLPSRPACARALVPTLMHACPYA